MEAETEPFLGIIAKVLFDQGGREAVKPGGHRRVGGEEISRPGGGQGHFKRLRAFQHETTRAFQHGERRMAFIQVADIRLEAERGEQTPSRDASSISCLRRNSGPPPITRS